MGIIDAPVRHHTLFPLMTSTLMPAPIEIIESSSARGSGPPSLIRMWRRRALRVALALVAIIAIGNLCILAASALAKTMAPTAAVQVPDDVASIHNFKAIDAKLWRGGAPSVNQYRALAAAGVTTVVDLRAEEHLDIPSEVLEEVGLGLVAIPIRDGQTPTTDQVQRFLDAVEGSDGAVYLHCGAGVGRTGTMAAAYRVTHGGGGWEAMRANLAVGPPSIEQLAFAASLDPGETFSRPNAAVVVISRALDAPRRIWKVLEGI